jgi:hypothetical protein
MSVVLSGMNPLDRGRNGARWVRYAIPVGAGGTAESTYGGPALPRVANSAALDANTNWASYYVEGGVLHLKLRATKATDYLSVRVKR